MIGTRSSGRSRAVSNASFPEKTSQLRQAPAPVEMSNAPEVPGIEVAAMDEAEPLKLQNLGRRQAAEPFPQLQLLLLHGTITGFFDDLPELVGVHGSGCVHESPRSASFGHQSDSGAMHTKEQFRMRDRRTPPAGGVQ